MDEKCTRQVEHGQLEQPNTLQCQRDEVSAQDKLNMDKLNIQSLLTIKVPNMRMSTKPNTMPSHRDTLPKDVVSNKPNTLPRH